jgi:hypothetical protein
VPNIQKGVLSTTDNQIVTLFLGLGGGLHTFKKYRRMKIGDSMRQKKIYLGEICGTYIETGELDTFDNQINRAWVGVFYSTNDRVGSNFLKTIKIFNFFYDKRIFFSLLRHFFLLQLYTGRKMKYQC